MGEIRSQITEKEKQILTQYLLHAGDGQLPHSPIPSLSKGLRSPANTTPTEDDTSVFFITVFQLYGYVKLKHRGLWGFFLVWGFFC